MTTLKLKLNYEEYLANKDEIDRILEAIDKPLDGRPFKELTLDLTVENNKIKNPELQRWLDEWRVT